MRETEMRAKSAARDYPGADVEIIGAWVWLTFAGKPSKETRESLKSTGFRWVHKRGQWAHDCGVKRKGFRLPYHPREKYGSVHVESDTDVASAS